MPRVRKLGVPTAQRELEDMIREQYGNMLTAADVGKFIGLKNPRSYTKWVKCVPTYIVNGRKKYLAADVAEKLYRDSL